MRPPDVSQPDVSIITPVRNRGPLIEATLRSVLAQSHPSVEHCVIDGASDDETPAILARYHEAHPERVRYVSAPDQGGCEGFNKGCALSRGRILGWLGSDDLLHPDAARRVVEHFDAHPEHDVIYGEAEFIDTGGRVVGRFGTRDFSVDRAINEGPCVAFPAVFYRRHVVDAVGGFVVGDTVCDFEWIVRVGKRFPLVRVPHTMCQFRLHPGSTSASIGDAIYPRGTYLVNRRHGGRLLSPVVLRYYQTLLFSLPGVEPLWRRLVSHRGFQPHMADADHRFAIFGAALTGFRCLQDLRARQRDVPVFIDNYPPDGAAYCDRPVCTPAAFMRDWRERVDAVIVATNPGSRYAPVMRQQLRALGWDGPVYCFGYSR